MRPIAIILTAASEILDCCRVPDPQLGEYVFICTACQARNKAAAKNHPEALLKCREKGYVTWKHLCGWTLTPDGRHVYNALRGVYNENQRRTVKPIE